MSPAALAAVLAITGCGPRLADPAADLYSKASHELKYGDLDSAISLAERGLASTPVDTSSPVYWRLRLLHAEALMLKRDLARAKALLAEAPPSTPPFASVRAKYGYLQGQLALFSGELSAAVGTLERTRQDAERTGDAEVALGARALIGLAQMRQRQWSEGQATLEAVAADAERAGDDYHLALALTNLGRAEIERLRYDAALPYLERAIDLERVTMRIRGSALNNAGLCYTRLGDYERAVGVQRRAVQGHETSAPIFLSQALGELGTTYAWMDNMPEATSHLQRAFDVATRAGLNDLAELWAGNLAATYIGMRDWDAAARLNAHSRKLNDAAKSPRVVFNLLNEGDIALGRAQYQLAVDTFQRVLATSTSDPTNHSDAYFGIARAHAARGSTRDAATNYERAIAIVEKAQSGLLKTDYKFTYLRRITDRYGEYIAMLMREGRSDRALEVADSSRARVLAERHGVNVGRKSSATEFRRLAARTGSTLLLYWLGREQSYAWAVTPDRIQSATLPKSADLEAMVRSHQTAIITSLAHVVQASSGPGDALYSALIVPFASIIKPGGSVIIVADGALTRVNFETLPVNGAKRHYWIEDVTVSVAPSLGTIAATQAQTGAARSAAILLFGDPAPTDPEFPRLQHAGAEIDAVTRAFPQAQKSVFRGERASPAAFRQAQPERFGLIHFTAHAAANAESPLDSAVILARDATGYKLYARDIADQKLDADLVTISACRSAGDRTYSGEGLVGFAWAFLRAGARRVLAGLWDVDDRSTAQLMTGVYEKLAEGRPPTAALREAKLALLAQGGSLAKPYYWGPFQLIVATP